MVVRLATPLCSSTTLLRFFVVVNYSVFRRTPVWSRVRYDDITTWTVLTVRRKYRWILTRTRPASSLWTYHKLQNKVYYWHPARATQLAPLAFTCRLDLRLLTVCSAVSSLNSAVDKDGDSYMCVLNVRSTQGALCAIKRSFEWSGLKQVDIEVKRLC